MFIKLVNLGRDAELKYTAAGKAVCNLAMAYSVGWGDNKKTQWIDGSLWGKKAESLVEYLKKGTKILITADDVELESYPKNDGTTGSKLKCRVVDIEFASPRQDGQQVTQAHPAPAPQQAPAQQQAPANAGGYDDFSNDIPF
jgi:single-strand DNA-binding protein